MRTTTTRNSMIARTRRLALTLAVGTTATLAACDSSDDLAGVREGRDVLSRVSAGGPEITRENAYRTAQTAANAVDGDGAVGGAGAVVGGVSASGLAQLDLDVLASATRDLGAEIRLLRDLAMAYQSAGVSLDELQRYNVQQDLDAVDERLVEHRAAADNAGSELASIDAELDTQRQNIAVLNTEAEGLRAGESALRDRALREDAQTRAETIREANVVRRQADGVEKQIDTMSFEVEALDRRRADAQRALDSAQKLISINEQSKERMQSRAAALRDEASTVRQRRSQLEQEIQTLAQSINGMLGGAFTEAVDAAVGAYERAAGTARGGRDAGRIAASGASAITQRGLAKAHLFAAIGNSAAAEAAERLAELGVSTQLNASALREAAARHQAQAGEAYGEYAGQASTAARGGDIDAAIESLESLSQSLQGIEPMPEPEPMSDDMSDEMPEDMNGFEEETEAEADVEPEEQADGGSDLPDK